MKRYRVWDGVHAEYVGLLSDAQVVDLRRRGYYVIPV